jgi:hypothetical protein
MTTRRAQPLDVIDFGESQSLKHVAVASDNKQLKKTARFWVA